MPPLDRARPNPQADIMNTSPDNDPVREVRHLLRTRALGALATALPGQQATGTPNDPPWPFASLATYALDHDLSPILLLSGLSDHTRAMTAEPRVSLLVEATAGFENPQAGPRASLLCRAARDPAPHLRTRFLARHPAAELYAGLGDFAIWRLTPERVHFVGGFGRARWLEWDAVSVDPAPATTLHRAEPGILEHMNSDHADAVDLYARRLLKRDGEGWRMTGIDSEGCDLRLGGEVARLDFPSPIHTADEARKVLVSLVGEARRAA
jgi:putative heme iron utilization protein